MSIVTSELINNVCTLTINRPDQYNALNEDVLNIEIRKFLKKVGITCQREIEKSIRNAVDNSIIKDDQTVSATVVLEIPEVKLQYTINGKIKLA